MYEHAIFCKSYRYDFPRLKNLFESIIQNAQDFQILLSVPKDDITALRRELYLPRQVNIVEDEAYTLQGYKNLPGWLQQQVCKLSVHRLGFAKSLYAVDSDFYFISKLNKKLFSRESRLCIIASCISTHYNENNIELNKILASNTRSDDSNIPKEILCEISLDDVPNRIIEIIKILKSNKLKNDLCIRDLVQFIYYIFNALEEISFMPGQIYHHHFLQEFELYFKNLGLSIIDIIKIAPYENIWYGLFILAKFRNIIPIRSLVLHFSTEDDVVSAQQKGLDEHCFARHFHAIAMASKHFERLTYACSP